jgi:hypothetical protein
LILFFLPEYLSLCPAKNIRKSVYFVWRDGREEGFRYIGRSKFEESSRGNNSEVIFSKTAKKKKFYSIPFNQ